MSTLASSTDAPSFEPTRESSSQSQPALGWMLFFTGVIVAAHLPLLLLHAENLWDKPHYQFFPIVLAGAGFLSYTRWPGLGELSPGSAWICYPLVGLVALLLMTATVAGSPSLGAVTFLLTLAVLLYGLGGRALLVRMLPAWVLMWLAVPPPFGLDRALITRMQLFTARWSSVVLDMANVPHVIQGAVVEVPEKQLFVEEACSGIHSLFATLCCTLFFVFWARIPVIRSILLLLSAVFWVVVLNVGRVVVVTLFDVKLHINLIEGLPHEILSYAIFGVILGLIVSTDQLLRFMMPSRLYAVKDESSQGAPTRLPDVRRTWVGAWPVAAAYGFLAVVQFILFTPGAGSTLKIAELGKDSLPAVCLGCQQDGYEMVSHDVERRDEGDYSQKWSYVLGRNRALVSLDYPFHGYHELLVCYRNNGWTIDPNSVKFTDAGGAGFTQAALQKPLEQHGYLIFGIYDGQGRTITPIRAESWRRFQRGLLGLQRLLQLLGVKQEGVEDIVSDTYQIQMLVYSYTPLTAAEKQAAVELFKQTEEILRQKIKAAQEAKG